MVKNKGKLLLSLTVILGILLVPKYYLLNAHAESKSNNGSIHYTIKKGDTFYLLGNRFNSSVSDISSMNPKLDPYNLIIRSKIKLPVGPGIDIHHVKKGDTLGNIATYYNSSVYLISEKNYIVNPNLIYPGDILAIPPFKQPPAPETTPPQPGEALLTAAELQNLKDLLTEIGYINVTISRDGMTLYITCDNPEYINYDRGGEHTNLAFHVAVSWWNNIGGNGIDSALNGKTWTIRLGMGQ
jgi:LysM repeat protein